MSSQEQELRLQAVETMPDIFRQKNISVIVDATKRCQLNCKYCYFGEKSREDADVCAISNSLRNFTSVFPELQSFNIHLMSGEPLVAWDKVKSLVESTKQMCSEKNVKFSWGLTSNLVGLTPDKAEYMLRDGAVIHCSIDGPADIQNENRPFLNGKPSFEAVVKNVPLALKVTPDDTARVTIRPEHAGEGKRIADFVLSLGFKYVGLFQATGPGENWTDERIKSFAKSVGRAIRESPVYENGQRAVSSITKGRVPKHNGDFFHFCGAGRSLWGMDTHGNIYDCHHLTNDKQYRLVSGLDSPDVIQNKLLSATVAPTLKNIPIPTKCLACPALDFCNGGCWATNLYSNGNSSEPDLVQCKTLIEFVQEVGDLFPIQEPPRHQHDKKTCSNCYSCQNCVNCQGCVRCESCQKCDTCQHCEPCQGCESRCDTRCQNCDKSCQGCEYCDSCDRCMSPGCFLSA